MTKDFGPFFLVLSSVTNLKEQFARVHKLFLPLLYKLWAHFLRPKRLFKTQIFEKKKATFPVKKIFDIFSRNIKHSKTQGTLYKVPYGILVMTVEKKINSSVPKRLLKTEISEKKALFPLKKKWPVFLVLSSMTKMR